MSHEQAVERFEELVSKYGKVIRAAIRSVAGPAAERLGEDAEQQVLLELWKQVAREQEITFPSSYLYRAAVRETIRLARQAQRVVPVEPETETLADASPEGQTERRIEAREIADRFRRVTARLRADRRTAVAAHLAGFGVREVMETNGWTYQRARNLIARGMADLRRALEDEDET